MDENLVCNLNLFYWHELQICVICKQIHGSCTQCCKCSTYYHAMCASRAGYRMEVSYLSCLFAEPVLSVCGLCLGHKQEMHYWSFGFYMWMNHMLIYFSSLWWCYLCCLTCSCIAWRKMGDRPQKWFHIVHITGIEFWFVFLKLITIPSLLCI